ncbi:MAG: hypothetical protein JXB03_00935 [Spirochaetales bacterium]|nr:hypothetical protein [Spirochaetales bacterium]
MTDTIVNGLFSLMGVLLGSVLSLVGIFVSKRMARTRQDMYEVCDQVAAYWILEDMMAKHIEALEGNSRAVKTIKEDFRSRVFDNKGIRPRMTEAEAIRFKKKI